MAYEVYEATGEFGEYVVHHVNFEAICNGIGAIPTDSQVDFGSNSLQRGVRLHKKIAEDGQITFGVSFYYGTPQERSPTLAWVGICQREFWVFLEEIVCCMASWLFKDKNRQEIIDLLRSEVHVEVGREVDGVAFASIPEIGTIMVDPQ